MKKRNFLILIVLLFVTILTNPFKIGAEEEQTNDDSNFKEQKTENINIKDMGDSGISLSLEEVEEVEKTNSFKELKEQNVSLKDATQEQAGDINLSGYVNENKQSSKAGNYKIQVQNIPADKQTLYLDNAGNLTKEARSNNVENEIEVLNNEIIKADKGIVQTLGGYDSVKFGYHTIEDAYNKENGTTFSGGAFDGQYIGTEEYNGQYFIHVKISGFDGYMSLDDVQIIPSSIVQSQSHYENINGDWVYFEAIDPLTGNGYTTYAIDKAPEWSEVGVKYYTYDDENYYEDNLLREDAEAKTSYNYFQNLPINSTANYTGSDYKRFLSYKKKTNSQYYNATNAFVEAQEKEQVNSLLLFAMANHEGAYGTSNLSKTCNNFFGYGAFDSDPNNACKAYKYNDPRSGIIAQAMHLKQMWSDIDDWRFHGSSLGDKSQGMNVTYASDPGWGKAIASMMYDIDSYLKGNENKKYRIGYIPNSEPFYTTSSLTNKLKLANGKDYTMVRNAANGSYSQPRVLITGETANALKLQLPTPVNISNSTTCTWTDAGPGSYAKYDGTYSTTVSKSTGSFACDYTNNYTAQQKWYPKKDANGYITYKIINDVPAKSPSTTSKVCKKLPNGNTQCTTEDKIGNTVIKRVVTETTPNNVQVNYMYETYNTAGQKTYYKRLMRYNNGKKKYESEVKYQSPNKKISTERLNYNTNGTLKDRWYEEYYTNGVAKKHIESDYNANKVTDYLSETYATNGKKTYYHRILRRNNGTKKYESYVRYYPGYEGIKSSIERFNFDDQGRLKDRWYEEYYKSGVRKKHIDNDYYLGKITNYFSETYASNGKKTYYHRILRRNNGTKKYESYIRYYSGNKGIKSSIERFNFDNQGRLKDRWYEEYYTSGVRKKHIDSDYYLGKITNYLSETYAANGKKTYYHRILRRNNGTKKYESYIRYYAGNEGKKYSIERINFKENGSKRDRWYETYAKNGRVTSHSEKTY